MNRIIYQLFFICLILSNILLSQEKDFEQEERELIRFAQIILTGSTDSIRKEANKDFYQHLLAVLNTEKSYKYQFNNIEHISILQPKDKKFKIMDADELGRFLSRASKKIKRLKDKLPPQAEKSFYLTKNKENPLDKKESHHASHVFRLGPGDMISLLNGEGLGYEAIIEVVDKGIIHGIVLV